MNLYQEVVLSFKKVGDPWSLLMFRVVSSSVN